MTELDRIHAADSKVSPADRDRLVALVRNNIQAELRYAKLMETSDVERCFVVLWRRPARHFRLGEYWEYGTHRACLSATGDDGMLVWGHYDMSAGPAYKDFMARCRSTA